MLLHEIIIHRKLSNKVSPQLFLNVSNSVKNFFYLRFGKTT